MLFHPQQCNAIDYPRVLIAGQPSQKEAAQQYIAQENTQWIMHIDRITFMT